MQNQNPSPGEQEAPRRPETPRRKGRRWLAAAVFVLTVLLAVLYRCDREPGLQEPPLLPPRGQGGPQTPPPPEPPPPPDTPAPESARPEPPPARPVPVPKPVLPPDTPPAPVRAPDTAAAPYLYADPWGGRHFDSVTVSLHCREGCVVLWSLEDSVHFRSYEAPLTFRRDAVLWLSGLDSLGRQLAPVRIAYVIERDPGACREGNMPVTVEGKTVCMDVYEWPGREGETPRAFVNWREAADSCASAGKRLCTAAEWKAGCQGPDAQAYPYAGRYNENHCPAKEAAAARSGRFPACRSYYGLYDMTGNLWEWTSTPAGEEGKFHLVAGGNWNAGGEARCGYAKFSFYPSVRYPFVGFRCCRDAD